MNDNVNCSIHGDGEATYVCSHINLSLKDRSRTGFVPVVDDEGGYQAFCTTCHDMTDEEWEREGRSLITMICIGCFRDAAALNGVEATYLEGLRA